MKRHRLAVSRRAERDGDVIFNWLAERSPDGAANWYRALCDLLESLTENPERHALASESGFFAREIRQGLFKTRHGRMYRVLFAVSDEIVEVLAVRGVGQDFVRAEDLELPH